MRGGAYFCWAVIAGVATGGLSPRARAADVPPPASEAPAPAEDVPATAAPASEQTLSEADAAIDAGDLGRARSLFERLIAEHPHTPEAAEARRALKILGARQIGAPEGSGAPRDDAGPQPSDGRGPIIMRREPYSLRTSERLRLTTWEKLDFGVTSFLYGMSLGFTYSLGQSGGPSTGPVALGALLYTIGAVVYLQAGDPDRGDLPLALAITSYLPTTTLLVANLAYENPDERSVSLAVAATGVVALPVAIIAARNLDLDPGDTQLVRDAGFWGMVLGTTGVLGFGGRTRSESGFEIYEGPSGRMVAGVALSGLFGGLALGTLGAMNSEVSLERVRVATWGGYAGAVFGALLGASSDERGVYRGVGIGALLGLTITFFATHGLDGIPAEDAPRRSAVSRLTPSLVPIVQANGAPSLGLGLTGLMF